MAVGAQPSGGQPKETEEIVTVMNLKLHLLAGEAEAPQYLRHSGTMHN